MSITPVGLDLVLGRISGRRLNRHYRRSPTRPASTSTASAVRLSRGGSIRAVSVRGRSGHRLGAAIARTLALLKDSMEGTFMDNAGWDTLIT